MKFRQYCSVRQSIGSCLAYMSPNSVALFVHDTAVHVLLASAVSCMRSSQADSQEHTDFQHATDIPVHFVLQSQLLVHTYTSFVLLDSLLS